MDNSFNNLLLYFLLAVLPGTVWLAFFLQKDKTPEPKTKILEIFFYGVLATIPTVFIELFLIDKINGLHLQSQEMFLGLKFIIGVSLPEEMLKYLVVLFFVLRKSCMDEPVDIPLYMIIAALGFATAENILLFSGKIFEMISEPFILAFVRFLGATLLHALCSGIIGYFIALGFYKLKQKWLYIIAGFSLAIILHGLFDYYLEWSIIKLTAGEESFVYVGYSALILFLLFVFLHIAVEQIKKLKSVCIIKNIEEE
jgi:RsiW-degrading membrane proteinase PrsW (M82 family)